MAVEVLGFTIPTPYVVVMVFWVFLTVLIADEVAVGITDERESDERTLRRAMAQVEEADSTDKGEAEVIWGWYHPVPSWYRSNIDAYGLGG